MKKKVSKLTLNRETLYLLGDVSLRKAAGGLPVTYYTCPPPQNTSECTVACNTATCLQYCGFTYDLLCYN